MILKTSLFIFFTFFCEEDVNSLLNAGIDHSGRSWRSIRRSFCQFEAPAFFRDAPAQGHGFLTFLAVKIETEDHFYFPISRNPFGALLADYDKGIHVFQVEVKSSSIRLSSLF